MFSSVSSHDSSSFFIFEFFRLYPILDRNDFSNKYLMEGGRSASLLLLWAVLSIGAAHCPDDCIRKAGFGDRLDARNTYFYRAKVIRVHVAFFWAHYLKVALRCRIRDHKHDNCSISISVWLSMGRSSRRQIFVPLVWCCY